MSLSEIDQDIRAELIAKGLGNLDSLDIARQKAVDETNARMLRKIVNRYGWPTAEMVGEDGMRAAYLVVDHGSHAFQKSMLEHVRQSYEIGDLTGGDYALLLDRVRVGDGLPQRYGSQAEMRNGRLVFFPIENPDRVDELRASLGLEPMREYIRKLEDLYGVQYRGILR